MFEYYFIKSLCFLLNYKTYFKDLFDSFPDHKKIVLLIFVIQIDVDLVIECVFLKKDVHCLYIEFEFFLNKKKTVLITLKMKKNQL